MNYFETKISYTAIDQNSGRDKKVKETYIIEAQTFGEAEEIMHKRIEAMMDGESGARVLKVGEGVDILSEAKKDFTEIFEYEEGEWWYVATVKILDVDEESGKEKMTKQLILLTAHSVEQCVERIKEEWKDLVVPFEVIKAEKREDIAGALVYKPENIKR